MKLSVIVPACNEALSISDMVQTLSKELLKQQIPHEIIVVDDHSKDNTFEILQFLKKEITELKPIKNPNRGGYGFAVRAGLEVFTGNCVAIMMADLSDSPSDLTAFYRKMVAENFDCVFGTRFSRGGKTVNYPLFKLLLNRLVNNFVKVVFGMKYDDTTNAFKLYKKEVIDGLRPFLSPHFNLTLEMPLKAIIRGYNFTILGNTWVNRKEGESKLKIKEMGSRYFFVFLYCLIEKYFSSGDFKHDRL